MDTLGLPPRQDDNRVGAGRGIKMSGCWNLILCVCVSGVRAERWTRRSARAPWSAKKKKKNLMTSLEECKCLPSGRAPRQIKQSYETGNYPGLETPLPTGRSKIEPCGSDFEAADHRQKFIYDFKHSEKRFTSRRSFEAWKKKEIKEES